MIDIPQIQYEEIVRQALAEDIGTGDITTILCVPEGTQARANMVAKKPGTIAGLDVAHLVFRLLDSGVQWNARYQDGNVVGNKPAVLAEIAGDARALLTAERTALNFVQRLSGIATTSARYAALVAGTGARIADTRKTTPGLRALEKYAVRVGGGFNHRLGLFDSVLIKDNHIRAAGTITRAVAGARARIPHTMKIEVEAATLAQVEQALHAGADIILLDNMDLATLRQAVALIGDRAITEASGGLTEDRIPEVAATGVKVLSVGALTHSAPALDISLDFIP